jgi:hypothetical protein
MHPPADSPVMFTLMNHSANGAESAKSNVVATKGTTKAVPIAEILVTRSPVASFE